MRQAKVNR